MGHIVSDLVLSLYIRWCEGVKKIHGVKKESVPPGDSLSSDTKNKLSLLNRQGKAIEPMIENLIIMIIECFREIHETAIIGNVA
jgi:hypothetical protein